MFESSTTTFVASTSRVPAKRKTKTAMKEIPEDDGDSIAVSKCMSDRWTLGYRNWVVYPYGSESLAYIQLRVYSTRLDVAKSYHYGIVALALSIRVTAHTHVRTHTYTYTHTHTNAHAHAHTVFFPGVASDSLSGRQHTPQAGATNREQHEQHE